MRLLTILLFLSITFSCYSQTLSSVNTKIDSLENIKFKLERLLKKLNNELNGLYSIQLNLQTSHDTTQGVEAIIKMEAKFRNEPQFYSTVIKKLPRDTHVIVYEFIEGYFKIKAENQIGYVQEMYFEKNNNLKNIIELGEKKDKEKTEDSKKVWKKRMIDMYGPDTADRIFRHQYWIGMTMNMAYESLGHPKRMEKSTFKGLIINHWHYDTFYLKFENDKLTYIHND